MKKYNNIEQAYQRKDNLTKSLKYDQKKLQQRIKKQREINCLLIKDSKSLIIQIKYLTNSLPILSELKKRKPDLYKSDHYILYKEEISEDLDHLMRCSALQDSQEEIEKAIIKGISSFQTKENNILDSLLKIKEIVFPKDNKSRYQKRKDLVIGLEEKKIAEDLWLLVQEKGTLRIQMDSIFFIA